MITSYIFQRISSLTARYQSLAIRHRSSSHTTTTIDYETAADETLESLTDAFEILLEKHRLPSDVTCSNGVLTVELDKYGTYVINKQTPNQQIWLSSPFSGPKRYDFLHQAWIYKHDGLSLHRLLNKEISNLFPHDSTIDFQTCSFGQCQNDTDKQTNK
jgi:frataxin